MAVTELVICIHIDQMEPILCGVEFDSQSPVVASHGRQVALLPSNRKDLRVTPASFAPQELRFAQTHEWETFSRVTLDNHLSEGRTVMVDFTADW